MNVLITVINNISLWCSYHRAVCWCFWCSVPGVQNSCCSVDV